MFQRLPRAAHRHGIAVIMDNTWATPLHFDALGHGVDLSLHSATKYIGGHSDILMGVMTANEAWRKALVETHGILGPVRLGR